jgi:hypothetical protein
MGLTYYLPRMLNSNVADIVYFQAVKGDSAIMSGVSLLPYIVTCCFLSATIGPIVTYTGRYKEVNPFISRLTTGHPHWHGNLSNRNRSFDNVGREYPSPHMGPH